MSPLAENLLIAALAFGVLFVGFRNGVTAVHSGSVNRNDNPLAFWIVMTIAGVGLIASLTLAIVGK